MLLVPITTWLRISYSSLQNSHYRTFIYLSNKENLFLSWKHWSSINCKLNSHNLTSAAQLLSFIRGNDKEFGATEEIAGWKSLDGNNNGEDQLDFLNIYELKREKLKNVTTDAAKNMTSRHGRHN